MNSRLGDNRIDPSMLTPADHQSLNRLNKLILMQDRPSLVGANPAERIPIPDAIYRVLVRVVENIRANKAMVLLPEKESFTTQAAADFLGVSRPFLVQLLDSETIPYYRVGAHRRVYFKDLLKYIQERDKGRRGALDSMNDAIEKAGFYEPASSQDDAPH